MKSRLAKLIGVAVVALAVVAMLAGSAVAKNGGGGGTTTTTTGGTGTVQYYCASGYTLVGTTSTLYKSAYDANKDGYVCVASKRGKVSYADDYSQLLVA